MRIAFVDQTGAATGGAQESFALLLQHLPARIDPHVVLFHEGEYADRLRSYGLDVSVVPVSTALTQLQRERIRAAGAASAPRAVFALARWFKARRITAAYTHTVKAHFLGAPAARLARIPCVMHLRDILEGGARSALRIVCAACSQERIAISKAVADSYALPKTSVVFNPVEIERFTDLPSREEACARLGIPFEPGIQTVGMVGRINRWKGHDRFLRVAAAVSKQRNVRFVIAGSPIFRDEDFLPELRRQAHEHGIADRVHFIPWVDDVQNVYAALDVHCNCSLREPFGRSIIEAAAAGVPTICFSDAGAAEVLTNGVNGCVVANGDEAAFARALTFVLESDERLACMKVSARNLATNFEPSKHAAQITEILERAAA